jgi:putative membrane protein
VSDRAVELRRLHPLTPILGARRLIAIVGALGLGMFRDELDRLEWIWNALHGDVQVGVFAKGVLVLAGVAGASVLAGWLAWRVTGFAIVEDASGVSTLLYHRGLLVRQRRQVRLNRVQSVDVNQPFVPRVFGLAEVRLDMAAGQEASVQLAYLRQPDAWALREEILRHTSAGGHPRAPAGDDAEPAPAPDLLIAEVSTPTLIAANLVDGIAAWALAVVWVVALVVSGVVWGGPALVAALSGIVPVTLAIVAQLRRQTVSMMRDANFRLFRTPTGIRTNAGLTTTVNRTIDFDRIQGVRIEEPYLWRRLGWARVLVDVAGAGATAATEHGVSLMPVADRPAAVELVRQVIGADIAAPVFAPAGSAARWLDPLGSRFLGVALLESGAVRRRGRWRRSLAYVPFARVQSVSARQGLLQRRLALATVHLDVPKGSARWTADHRDHADAADLVRQLSGRQRGR